MRIGILISGSLYWDCLPFREQWRQDRLYLDDKQYVKVPIRYGRCSSTRGNSYTMVISKGLVRKNQLGQAIIVPCQQLVNSSEDLIKEAKYLWAAESNRQYITDIPTCKSWGRIVLLKNPNLSIPGEISRGWCGHIYNNTNYGEELKHTDSEESAIDESGGFLDIDWPESVDGSVLEMDALLATVTNPNFTNGDYPSVHKIVNAWNTSDGKNYVDYFYKNRAHGIKTFQDIEIQDRLQQLWP